MCHFKLSTINIFSYRIEQHETIFISMGNAFSKSKRHYMEHEKCTHCKANGIRAWGSPSFHSKLYRSMRKTLIPKANGIGAWGIPSFHSKLYRSMRNTLIPKANDIGAWKNTLIPQKIVLEHEKHSHSTANYIRKRGTPSFQKQIV